MTTPSNNVNQRMISSTPKDMLQDFQGLQIGVQSTQPHSQPQSNKPVSFTSTQAHRHPQLNPSALLYACTLGPDNLYRPFYGSVATPSSPLYICSYSHHHGYLRVPGIPPFVASHVVQDPTPSTNSLENQKKTVCEPTPPVTTAPPKTKPRAAYSTNHAGSTNVREKYSAGYLLKLVEPLNFEALRLELVVLKLGIPQLSFLPALSKDEVHNLLWVLRYHTTLNKNQEFKANIKKCKDNGMIGASFRNNIVYCNSGRCSKIALCGLLAIYFDIRSLQNAAMVSKSHPFVGPSHWNLLIHRYIGSVGLRPTG